MVWRCKGEKKKAGFQRLSQREKVGESKTGVLRKWGKVLRKLGKAKREFLLLQKVKEREGNRLVIVEISASDWGIVLLPFAHFAGIERSDIHLGT